MTPPLATGPVIRAVRRLLVGMSAVMITCMGLWASPTGASNPPKAVTITVTITPSQWANIKASLVASHVVPSDAYAKANLLIPMCGLEGTDLGNYIASQSKMSQAPKGVTFRFHLSAASVANANRDIRTGHCGKIHTIQQDFKSAYAQWAAFNHIKTTPVNNHHTTTTVNAVPARKVQGTATTLGAGNFTGGKDVAVGLYNVTAGPGQSGNFIVQGTDSYDEILGGDPSTGGVPVVRAKISTGDQIQISGLSQVIFTPVSTPFVTTHTPVTLYAGTWTVGQDLGPGGYVATPGAGQSGNFIIENAGVNEILGGDPSAGGVPNVTFTVSNGDIIGISSLSQVTLTPS